MNVQVTTALSVMAVMTAAIAAGPVSLSQSQLARINGADPITWCNGNQTLTTNCPSSPGGLNCGSTYIGIKPEQPGASMVKRYDNSDTQRCNLRTDCQLIFDVFDNGACTNPNPPVP